MWWPLAAHRASAGESHAASQHSSKSQAPTHARAPAECPRPSTSDQSLQPPPQERSTAWGFVPPSVPATPMPLEPGNVFSGKVRASTLLGGASTVSSSTRMLQAGHFASAKNYAGGGEIDHRGFRRDAPPTWHGTQRSSTAWRCEASQVRGAQVLHPQTCPLHPLRRTRTRYSNKAGSPT